MQSGERMLKFVQGVYTIGETDVTGRTFVAYVDQCGYGWTLFLGGKMISENVTLLATTEMPERPQGHDDQTAWETGPDGRKRDPLVFQHHLPVADAETGAIAVFKTGSKGGANAIGELFASFARNPVLGYPVVRLDSGKYKNKKTGGFTHYPIFTIVGHQPFGGGRPDPVNIRGTGDGAGVPIETLPTRIDRNFDDFSDF